MEDVMPKTCSRCQTENVDAARNCSNCGAPLTTGTGDANAGSTTSSRRADTPAYKFDAVRWTTADRIAGIASLVLLISLFLSWFSATVGPFSNNESGLSAHAFLYVVMILCIAIIAYLAYRAGWDDVPLTKKVPHLTLMLVATTVNLVLTVIAFIEKPGGVGFNTGIGWDFGAVLALIASIVAAAPFLVPRLRAKTM